VQQSAHPQSSQEQSVQQQAWAGAGDVEGAVPIAAKEAAVMPRTIRAKRDFME
jgi:hypothetical protein